MELSVYMFGVFVKYSIVCQFNRALVVAFDGSGFLLFLYCIIEKPSQPDRFTHVAAHNA